MFNFEGFFILLDLALALGISVEELSADRVEQRREEIKTKLQKGGYVVLTLVLVPDILN